MASFPDIKQRLKTIFFLCFFVVLGFFFHEKLQDVLYPYGSFFSQQYPSFFIFYFLLKKSILLSFLGLLVVEWWITARQTKSFWPGLVFIFVGFFSFSFVFSFCRNISGGVTSFFSLRNLPFYILVTIFLTDILAYIGGRFFKGPKLCPSISPNKTISGFLCGLSSSLLMTFFLFLPCFYRIGFFRFFTCIFSRPRDLYFLLFFLFFLFVSLGAQLGDLLESWIKRQGFLKDAGFLLPGHGGLLDRLDSIFGAFFFVFMLLLFLNAVYNWM